MCYFFAIVVAAITSCAYAQQVETINGTIFVNNQFQLFINGKMVGADPLIPHNAYNVSFEVSTDEDITFAILAIDNGNESTGLEFGNRCLGSGGMIGMFSNGVVTNSSWSCYTVNYGPVNWLNCYGAIDRNGTLKLQPLCRQDSTPPVEGCTSRVLNTPANWTAPDFDDSRWQYAQEYEDSQAGFGVPPTGCTDPSTVVSPDVDPQGVNLTCQANVNWSAYGRRARFIWREDLWLDNTLLCRYTLKRAVGSNKASAMTESSLVMLLAVILAVFAAIN